MYAGDRDGKREVDARERRVNHIMSFVKLTIVWPCCGCSCHVCANGHGTGEHTPECLTRMIEEAIKDGLIQSERQAERGDAVEL